MQYRKALYAIAPAFVSLLTGCFDAEPLPPAATDLNSARALIESGGIPHPDSISIDRFLEEHLVTTGLNDSAQDVALRVATAWHHDFDALTPQATIQIAYGAAIDLDEFTRGPLNLALVIDRSRLMDTPLDLRNGTTRFDLVRIALDRLLAKLTPDDLVSIIAFDESSEVLAEAVRGTNVSAIKGALDALALQRGLNPAGGLRRGFQTVASYSRPQRLDRILLFTDAELHRLGAAQMEDLFNAMRQAAQANVGTTLFGVGSAIGDDLRNTISQIRGGNTTAFGNFEELVEVIDEDFDFLVAPVAYDVTISLDVPFEFDVVDVHGQSAAPPYGRNLLLSAPTLFLTPDQSDGLAVIRLRAGSLANFSRSLTAGTVILNYTTARGAAQSIGPVLASLPSGQSPAAAPPYFQNDDVRRGVLVLNTALTFRRACEDLFRSGTLTLDVASRTAAMTRISEFLDYFDDLSAGLPDQLSPSSRSLSQERSLLVKFMANLGGTTE